MLQIAEIARVLKPGGVFVASTILSAVSPLGQLIGDDNTRFLSQFVPMLFPGTARAYKWCAAVACAALRILGAARLHAGPALQPSCSHGHAHVHHHSRDSHDLHAHASAQLSQPIASQAAAIWLTGAHRRSCARWEEAEIKDLCATMGLKDYRRHRNNRFILFTVRKPGGSPSSS